jgi:FAD/FMN-containing dehydrogenase
MATANPLDADTLQRLRDLLHGPVITPRDPGYDDARQVWNARFDRRPAAIARCTGVADVRAAVTVARESGLLVAVRSGGHDYSGNSVCDDGLVIDLSRMNGLRVDPKARTAWVQPGVRWGACYHEAHAFGLSPTGGTVSTVGVAGFTLGGGTGYLVRRHGLGLDNLNSADVVTADGEFRRASEQENPDLFWALRGGSGNFGVVTSFELALHEIAPEVLAGQIVYPIEDAPHVLRAYREFMAEAPEELQCYAVFLRVPPTPEFPEKFHGRVAIDLLVVHSGPVEAAEKTIAPLQGLGTPILRAVGPVPWVAVHQMLDAGAPKGQRWYSKAHYLTGIPDDAIDAVVDHAEGITGAFTMAYFEPMGGAVGRIDPAATAFPHRDAAYSFHILAGWTDPSEDAAVVVWTRALHAALAPYSTGGVYVNLLGEDEPDRVRGAYGPNYDRLARLKRKYDPDNLFRVNHNIEPAG